MLNWFFTPKPVRYKGRHLAHCAERSPGSLRLEQNGQTVTVTVLEADGMGAVIQADQPLEVGHVVVGQYVVSGVAFAFRGEVQSVADQRANSWTCHIRYLLGT